jgi:DNA modification methylase
MSVNPMMGLVMMITDRCQNTMTGVVNGSFFLMTIQEHVGAMWEPLSKGGTFKNMIVWKNSSMPVKNRFCIAYQPILWFVKDPENYTFNYGFEKRESNVVLPWGRKNNAHSIRDIWDDIPFVSGGCISSKEAILAPGTKRKKHPAQMPVKLANRMIGYCTNEGDTVLDLFCGSGTMPFACSLSGRKCIGIEKSPIYCDDIVKRVTAEVFCG